MCLVLQKSFWRVLPKHVVNYWIFVRDSRFNLFFALVGILQSHDPPWYCLLTRDWDLVIRESLMNVANASLHVTPRFIAGVNVCLITWFSQQQTLKWPCVILLIKTHHKPDQELLGKCPLSAYTQDLLWKVSPYLILGYMYIFLLRNVRYTPPLQRK